MARLEITGPGIAFWRARKHGWDRWGYGVRADFDRWVWALGLVALRINWAPGFHFDDFTLIDLTLGPLRIRAYIVDKEN